jgi:2-dehydropantoate 2-reductase
MGAMRYIVIGAGGVPTPVNEVLQRLANQAARERRSPGSATPAEVLALV